MPDGREDIEVEVGNEKPVPEICYLGDMLFAGDGSELVAITRCSLD